MEKYSDSSNTDLADSLASITDLRNYIFLENLWQASNFITNIKIHHRFHKDTFMPPRQNPLLFLKNIRK